MNISNNILLFYPIPVPLVINHLSKYLFVWISYWLSHCKKKFVSFNNVGVMTGASFDVIQTKLFKFNFALKKSLNTNLIIPQKYMGMIDTINL